MKHIAVKSLRHHISFGVVVIGLMTILTGFIFVSSAQFGSIWSIEAWGMAISGLFVVAVGAYIMPEELKIIRID